MKPYYEHAGITIYHGDCREVLPDVWFGVDLVLTDPPYGICLDTAYSRIRPNRQWQASHGKYVGKNHPIVIGDDKPFDPAHLMFGTPSILWGGNHYAARLPSASGWLVWDKRDGLASNMFADAELAWTNIKTPTRIFRHKWLGYMRASEVGNHCHPTQKPVALMRWCMDISNNSGFVIDPYMGSGPVLVAAKETRRRAIGIEIEERYCEIAAKRLQQDVLPLELPA